MRSGVNGSQLGWLESTEDDEAEGAVNREPGTGRARGSTHDRAPTFRAFCDLCGSLESLLMKPAVWDLSFP